MEKVLEFKCVAEKCLYNSSEFKIYGVSVNSFNYPDIYIGKYGTASLKGNFQELNLGIEYTVKAEEDQDKYGIGYKVINISREKPTDEKSTRNFLYEILTPNQADVLLGVYPNIVDKIMKNDLKDIDLSKTKGIKEYTFDVIKRKVIENFKLSELVEEFKGLINISTLNKLYNKYPSIEKVREVIRQEPYECLCKLSGIGFKTADGILLEIDRISKENISNGENPIIFFNNDLKTSHQRMKSCIDYVLGENESNGNTRMKFSEVKKQCEILAKEAKQHFDIILNQDKDIFFDKKTLSVARQKTYETELYIAQKIVQGLLCRTKWDCDYSKYTTLDNFKLTNKQCLTTEYMCSKNLVVLNGFGGSGKSSSTKSLINMLKNYNKTFVLLAPTGRAAKVLSGYTGCDAKTIHRGLGYIPPNEWRYNSESPINCDIVIVDEFSMVDIFLMKQLLEAIDFTRTKLLLIGDDAQIPSVAAGNILYDLLNCGLIPTITLDEIFRYGEGGLSTVATDTRKGEVYLEKDKAVQIFGEDKSYAFMSVKQENMVDYIVNLYQKILSQGCKLEDIIVLSCYNKGDYGTIEINKKIQQAVNPNNDSCLKFGEVEYRLNDIVINCANNYDAILYNNGKPNKDDITFISNGEIGRIIKVEYNAIVVDYDETIIYIPKSDISNIKLAYAISTHKSQGGQFKNVILGTPKAHTYMLNSNLLYVGESRAKERCFHVGDVTTVNRALKKKENYDRQTFLKELIISNTKEACKIIKEKQAPLSNI